MEDDRGASNTAELAVLLRAHCMVRRHKEEVRDQLAQLPVKHRHKVELVVASSQEMEERREEAEREGQEAGPQEVQQRKKLLQWFAASALAKLPAVQGHLRGVLAEDRKCLVFCHHRAMVAGVVDLLEEQDVGFVKIDGGVGSKERARLVQRFQTDHMGLTPAPDLGSRDISKDLVIPAPSQKTREYAYSTRNRSI